MTITVGTLITWLSEMPKDTPVILQLDEEGNGYHNLHGVEIAHAEDASAYDIEVVHPDDIEDDSEYDEVVIIF